MFGVGVVWSSSCWWIVEVVIVVVGCCGVGRWLVFGVPVEVVLCTCCVCVMAVVVVVGRVRGCSGRGRRNWSCVFLDWRRMALGANSR